jgi:hypothetical protein
MDVSDVAQDPALAVDPPAGRAGVLGAAIGFLLLTVSVTILGSLAGASFGGAFGMGVYVGIFGGFGVGGYLGASLCLSLAQKRSYPNHPSVKTLPRTGRPDDKEPHEPITRAS